MPSGVLAGVPAGELPAAVPLGSAGAAAPVPAPPTRFPIVAIACAVKVRVVLSASARAAFAVFCAFWTNPASCAAPVSDVLKSGCPSAAWPSA